jgi:hypothetical protein
VAEHYRSRAAARRPPALTKADKPPRLLRTPTGRTHSAQLGLDGVRAQRLLIDRDITAIPPKKIRDARVLKTVAGGRMVYSAG